MNEYDRLVRRVAEYLAFEDAGGECAHRSAFVPDLLVAGIIVAMGQKGFLDQRCGLKGFIFGPSRLFGYDPTDDRMECFCGFVGGSLLLIVTPQLTEPQWRTLQAYVCAPSFEMHVLQRWGRMPEDRGLPRG